MKTGFIAFFFLVVSIPIHSQDNFLLSGKSLFELKSTEISFTTFDTQPIQKFQSAKKTTLEPIAPNLLKQQLLNPYKVEDLAFFCKLEVKIEKKLKIPFKFRVGEVQYTERMEGKY